MQRGDSHKHGKDTLGAAMPELGWCPGLETPLITLDTDIGNHQMAWSRRFCRLSVTTTFGCRGSTPWVGALVIGSYRGISPNDQNCVGSMVSRTHMELRGNGKGNLPARMGDVGGLRMDAACSRVIATRWPGMCGWQTVYRHGGDPPPPMP